MKIFVTSLFISCSLLSLNAYGIQNDDETGGDPGISARSPNIRNDDCAESYEGEATERTANHASDDQKRINETRKRPRENPKDKNSHSLKRPRTDSADVESPDEPMLDVDQGSLANHGDATSSAGANSAEVEMLDSRLFLVPPPGSFRELLERNPVDKGYMAIRKIIVDLLSPQDQQSLALVSRGTHESVVLARMQNDPRGLSGKPRTEGPPINSPDLYRFNAAVWHAHSHMAHITPASKQYTLSRVTDL